ncbi:MAG: 2-hydroxyacyl-CoA dehydratase [Lacrimispora celerecrescens]|nr:2-hydroxyacyl-CoA dehydratase [Lacrimispora celerecrescens]
MATLNELLESFHEIACSPKKQLNAYLEQGKKVVACVPVYTPEELIHSMGLVPMGAWGADIELKESKKYFPAFICSIMQSILELGIKGEYKGISAIVIPSLCDSLKCLGQNWKYAVKDIPFIPMTYPQNRKPESGKKFTKASYERVIKDLEAAASVKFSEASLARSNEIYNEHNGAMRKLAEVLEQHPSITAVQRRDIFKSAYFMRKEDHTALVGQLIEALSQVEEKESKIKVITTGILADSDGLLKIFDEHGLQIAADDVAHESRQYRTDVNLELEPLEGLADKFSRMDHCSVLYDPEKKRAGYIVDMAKKYDARGVVVLLTKFCDPEEFDYVIVKKACDRAGIPIIQMEVDRQMVNYEQAGTMIEAFKDML